MNFCVYALPFSNNVLKIDSPYDNKCIKWVYYCFPCISQKKPISIEGGFAFVYVVQDMQTEIEYALKRLLGADKQACNNIIKELNLHKQSSGHPNIAKFIAASFIDKTSSQGNAEYLLLTELCKGNKKKCVFFSIIFNWAFCLIRWFVGGLLVNTPRSRLRA